jgi:DNA-directed RNA polymerase subunit RPC12/RpoP
MPRTNVRCPECDARIKVMVSPDRTSVRCPECGARVPLGDEGDDRDDDDRPARRSRRRDDEDDEDEAPRGRRRREREEDDDEDDRPRRKKKRRRREEGDGPWLVAAGVAALCFVTTFAGALLVKGTEGLAPGEDGPLGKLFGLGICFLVSLVLMPLGVIGVKNRTAYGRWGMQITGTTGVILGMIQAAAGGLMCGFALYGVLFTLIHGR